jgi:hypothetical protein
MIEYTACIIRDGMTDQEIYQTIATSSAYYVLDARTSPDKPLDMIFDEQKHRKVFNGITSPVPTNGRRPKPIKIS